MWHRYVLKLLLLVSTFFVEYLQKLLLPLMYVVLDGPILYLHKWLFWYMEFHLIWSVFYAYLWWSTAVMLKSTQSIVSYSDLAATRKVFTQTLLRQVITSRMIEKLIVIWWPQRFIVRNKSIEICLRLFRCHVVRHNTVPMRRCGNLSQSRKNRTVKILLVIK